MIISLVDTLILRKTIDLEVHFSPLSPPPPRSHLNKSSVHGECGDERDEWGGGATWDSLPIVCDLRT